MTTAITELFSAVRNTIQNTVGAAMLSLWIGGQPVPASRPRVSKFGVYYSKTYNRWLKESWQYVDSFDAVPTDRPVIVMVEAVFEKAKTSKLTHPTPDIDNLEKGPLDQINKLHKTDPTRGIWEDDKQVVFLVGAKRFAEPGEEPGFRIWYCELNDQEED